MRNIIFWFLFCPFILFGQINLNQLAQGGASTNDFIKWNGTRYAPSATADGNGIYTGNGSLPVGGTLVTLGSQSLRFLANTSVGTERTALRITTPYSADDAFTHYLVGVAPADSFKIYNFDNGTHLHQYGIGGLNLISNSAGIFLNAATTIQMNADSFDLVGVTTRTTGASIMTHQGNGTLSKLVGISNGDVIKWNGTSWSSAADEGMADFDNGISNNENSGVVRLGNTYMTSPFAPFLSNRKINIDTFRLVIGNTPDSVLFVINGKNSKIGIGTADPVAKLDITAKSTDDITGLIGLNLRDVSGFKYGLRISGGTSSTANRFLIMNTLSDSLRFQEGGGDYTMQAFGSDLFIATSDILDLGGDSLHYTESMIESKTAFPFLVGLTTGSHQKKIAGAYDGDFLSYVNGSWRQSNNIRMSKLRFTDTHTITGTGTVTASSTISDNKYIQSDQATLQVNLPASPTDNQHCVITFHNVITTLTLSGNGNNIYPTASIPTTAPLGYTISLKFHSGFGWVIQ